jgi:hypothetical protein
LKFRRNRHGHPPIVARPAGHSGRLIPLDLANFRSCRRPSIAAGHPDLSQTASN